MKQLVWRAIRHDLSSQCVLLSNVFDRHQARVRCYHGANSNITRAGVLIPKFVSLHGILVYELRNQKDTSKSMILVWLLVQKSA
jgi:hypothetical protein